MSCLHLKVEAENQSRIFANLDPEELKLAEFYLAETQRLAHIGSWGWQVAGGQALHLSEEWYRIFGFDPRKECRVGKNGSSECILRIEASGKEQSNVQSVRGRITT